MYNSIRPGQVWLDTDGNRIQAHGGSVFYKNGVYYWYGENKEKTVSDKSPWHWGVRMYSSSDLYNWKSEGIICDPVTDDENHPMNPYTLMMDRPHILYNDSTKKYVMWLKIMNKNNTQKMAVAVCDTINGKYEVINYFHPLDMNSGDFDLVKNPTDGKAYFYFERVHSELICADLTSDYTGVTGYYSTHFPHPTPPFVREAPACFNRNGKHYMFTSGTTGYFPNRSEVASADCFHGPWTVLGDPHVDDKYHTSFHSQITSVFKHPHIDDLYIALADRWLVDIPDVVIDIDQLYIDLCEGSEKSAPALEKVLSLSVQNTSIADYVWLPVKFKENGTPYIEWVDEWTVQ